MIILLDTMTVVSYINKNTYSWQPQIVKAKQCLQLVIANLVQVLGGGGGGGAITPLAMALLIISFVETPNIAAAVEAADLTMHQTNDSIVKC